VSLSLFLWLVSTVALALRRDWSGALALGVVYSVINVPFLFLLLGHVFDNLKVDHLEAV
jgi:hypothetical protein